MISKVPGRLENFSVRAKSSLTRTSAVASEVPAGLEAWQTYLPCKLLRIKIYIS